MDEIKVVLLPTESDVIVSDLEKNLAKAFTDLYEFMEEEFEAWLSVDRSKTMDRICDLKSDLTLCAYQILKHNPFYFMCCLRHLKMDVKTLMLCFRTFGKRTKMQVLERKNQALLIYKELVVLLMEYLISEPMIKMNM